MVNKISTLWIVGCGQMALDHYKVASKYSNSKIEVVGNHKKSAAWFHSAANKKPIIGGLKKALQDLKLPDQIIISVNIEKLLECSQFAIDAGIKNILIEKPCSLNLKDLENLHEKAQSKKLNVYIAYNRRHYQSVEKLILIAKQDDGIRGVKFDFTEWQSRVEASSANDHAKKKWVISNSSHVIDLAFFLIGGAAKIDSRTFGGIDWHPNASIFLGQGISKKNVPFSYFADWESGGSWSIEVMTKKRKIILKPLEKIFEQKKDSLVMKEIQLPQLTDNTLKDGLIKQFKSFENNDASLCSLQEHVENFKIFSVIGGYD